MSAPRGSENGNRYSPTGYDVLTRSGVMIDVRHPWPTQIRLADVAYSLAHQERFTGHCPLAPTIAQHSLAVSHIAGLLMPDEIDPGVDAEPAIRRVKLAALMHDAPEMLVSDLNGAVKSWIRKGPDEYEPRQGARSTFDTLEDAGMLAVEGRFDCAVSDEWQGLIHEADCLACSYEMAWGGWCQQAIPPAWVLADPYVQRCYAPPPYRNDGGQAAFHRQALILGAEPDA